MIIQGIASLGLERNCKRRKVIGARRGSSQDSHCRYHACTYQRAAKLWAGTVVVQPDAKTRPHHDDLETVLYIVRGRARMRWGDALEFSDEAGPGDFIFVPPYVPHHEINASREEACEAIVVRSGQDPVVVNLDMETPEPASAGRSQPPFHPASSGDPR